MPPVAEVKKPAPAASKAAKAKPPATGQPRSADLQAQMEEKMRAALKAQGTMMPDWAIRVAVISRFEELRTHFEMKKDGVTGTDAGHNDIYDAERHARWMYRLTSEVGEWAAEEIGAMKEMWGMLKGAGGAETGMDLHNNEVGRKAALAKRPIPDRNTTAELVYLDDAGKPRTNGERLSLLRAAARGKVTAVAAKAAAAARPKTGVGETQRQGLTEWGGDSSQWRQEKKVASLAPSFQPKVERIMERLADAGFQPKIIFGWRSTEVQKELVKQRKSTVSFSFHNAQKPDGTPSAWAVDLVDARWGWKTPDCMEFFRALGAEAKAEGLVWGGDWKGFPDWAHIQDRQNSELKQVKVESGL